MVIRSLLGAASNKLKLPQISTLRLNQCSKTTGQHFSGLAVLEQANGCCGPYSRHLMSFLLKTLFVSSL